MTQLPKNLTHYFLVPSPSMDDERFRDALIYICRHSSAGAWGFIINQTHPFLSVGGLLGELDLPSSYRTISTPVMHGGFMRPEAGFVLHTGQPNFTSSFVIGDNVCLTTSKDVLKWIADDGLSYYLVCMGFCNWAKGQLEQEILAKDWFIYPADAMTIFGDDFDKRLAKIRRKLHLATDDLEINTDSDDKIEIMGRA